MGLHDENCRGRSPPVVFADQVKEQLSLEFLLVGRVGVGHESVFGEGWGSYSVPVMTGYFMSR